MHIFKTAYGNLNCDVLLFNSQLLTRLKLPGKFPEISRFTEKWTDNWDTERKDECVIHGMHTNLEVSTIHYSGTNFEDGLN